MGVCVCVLWVFVCAELAFFPPFSQFLLLLGCCSCCRFCCHPQSTRAAANGSPASRWSLKKDKKFPQRKNKIYLGAAGGCLLDFLPRFSTRSTAQTKPIRMPMYWWDGGLEGCRKDVVGEYSDFSFSAWGPLHIIWFYFIQTHLHLQSLDAYSLRHSLILAVLSPFLARTLSGCA